MSDATAASAPEQRRALVVSAHPDDIEFGCAGTIAGLVDADWAVTYCIATSGESGSQDAADEPADFGVLRRHEARAAAKAVGVDDVRFLGFADGHVEPGQELLEAIARVFRQVRPHRVFAMRPEPLLGSFLNHPDHRHVGQATLDVCLAAGTTGGWFRHLALEEDLAPWKGNEHIWLFGPGKPQHVEPIDGTIDRKLEALACHASQVTPETLAWVRGRFGDLGASAGHTYGEGFEVLSLRR